MKKIAVIAALLVTVFLMFVPAPVAVACGYINVDGNCIPSPDHTRSNLSDGDGTYSHSQHDQGSGSWHGGTGKHR